jgi:hypothetical protein
MERQRTALQGILDKAVKVDQSTIESATVAAFHLLPDGKLRLSCGACHHYRQSLPK